MEWEVFLIRIIVCFLLSFFVGLERQFRGRCVGLRTTILVSMGAFLFVSFSFYVQTTDMTRIASQVVTGIGFLGAGVIIKDGINVRGLTTAATLWCDAAIGILCVRGLLLEVVTGTLLILFANTILRVINKKISDRRSSKKIFNRYLLKFEGNKDSSREVMRRIYEFIRDQKIILNSVENEYLDNGNSNIRVSFDLMESNGYLIEKLVEKFNKGGEVISYVITREESINEEDEEEL